MHKNAYFARASLAAATSLLGLAAAASTASATPVGYVPSTFSVRGVTAAQGGQLMNLYDANLLIDGTMAAGADKTAAYPVLNFVDPQHYSEGRFRAGDVPFPTNTAKDDDNFVVHATALVAIPSAGDWTFATSSDDGIHLDVGGQTFTSVRRHAPKDTMATFHFDAAGVFPLDLSYYEHIGRAELELFAAPGDVKKFKTKGAQWHLVGDTAHGGLEVVAVDPSVTSTPPPTVGSPIPTPEPAGLALVAVACATLVSRRRR